MYSIVKANYVRRLKAVTEKEAMRSFKDHCERHGQGFTLIETKNNITRIIT